MYWVVLAVHAILSLGLISVVLLQSGRSAGLSGAIAGGAETLFGKKRGLDDLLARYSVYLAAAFMVTSFVLAILH